MRALPPLNCIINKLFIIRKDIPAKKNALLKKAYHTFCSALKMQSKNRFQQNAVYFWYNT